MPNKNKENNALQKGERRQKIYENQNNVGNDKNKSEYTDLHGNPIK